PVAGGAVKTSEVTLPGFRHDLCAMNLSMFAGSPFHAAYKTQLEAAGLSLMPVTHSFSSVLDDGTWLGVDTDLNATATRMARRSEADARVWKAMAGQFGADAPHLFGLLGTPVPSWAMARALWRAWRAKGLPWCMDTARLLLSSPRNWLSARFEDDGVRALMAAWGMHLDFGPDVAGGALFPYLESMANQCFGMALGRGGADTIIRAMVRCIEQAGGEVRTGTPVASIRVSGGRAQGVTLADGTQLDARRAVVANVHPRQLYGRLLGKAAPDPLPAPARLRPGPGTMMIHLAQDALPAWRAGAELQRFAYVHVAPSLDQMARTYREAMAGLLPAEPVLVV
ncbi:MAG: NAD(P)/FAD-dependent oxidoreductase, partial [Proteobacteria bacterium]|nr:NAD(P)/FAD-dependent oxidoreductase [Pseudomonadota bacterium]